MAKRTNVMLVDQVEPLILTLRGQKVLLDGDLAALYGTTTKALNQAVKRNRRRFPADFRFQLTAVEKQEVVTNCDHLARLRFSPTRPYAFTEHGAVMAASVLNTARAVDVSLFVVRAFVRLRALTQHHRELSKRLDELESTVGGHDAAIRQLVAAIRELMQPADPPPRRGRIGFGREQES
jgi:hypothetical protein